jgi:hypothetical protein
MELARQAVDIQQLQARPDATITAPSFLDRQGDFTDPALQLVGTRPVLTSTVCPLDSLDAVHGPVPTSGPVVWTGKYSKLYTGQTPEGYVLYELSVPSLLIDFLFLPSWDPIKEAYNTDIRDLKRQLNAEDQKWLDGKHTIVDLQKALSDAQSAYQNRSAKSDIRSALVSCSQRVVFYAGNFYMVLRRDRDGS